MDYEAFIDEWHNSEACVLVHTSGSTGAPKPMMVEKRRMEASARITCAFLGLQSGDTALLCMPLDYIAGKMMVVRAITCGLRLIRIEPCSHPMAEVCTPIHFAAMVPLQVANSLKVAVERQRLMAIKHLIIGGGAIDDDLERELRDFPNAVWSTYGMTETLSHIALRRLNGPQATDAYRPLPDVEMSLSNEGTLQIFAPHIHPDRLTTNDLAELLPDGSFLILGRRDNVICSGGLKLSIEELESRLADLPVPFQITAVPDARLGEAVTLLYTAPQDMEAELAVRCRERLERHAHPRHFLRVAALPLTETGKPARKEARALALRALSGHPC